MPKIQQRLIILEAQTGEEEPESHQGQFCKDSMKSRVVDCLLHWTVNTTLCVSSWETLGRPLITVPQFPKAVSDIALLV